MEAFCIERLIDPRTHKPVAAYGWLQERRGFSPKYWVSIEASPVEFFYTEETAKFYYDHSIVRLMVAIHMNGLNGTNGHKKSKRKPPVNRGPRKRTK